MNRRRPFLASAATTLAALFAQLNQATAADLLRPNSGSSVGSGGVNSGEGTATGAPGGALREQTLVNSRDALARSTRALQAVRDVQLAARNAALAGPANLGPDPLRAGFTLPDVPNGLAPGGLVVERNLAGDPVRWQGANLPVEVASAASRVQVSVTQTASQALLNWQTFNIGKETDLKFDQSAGGSERSKWVVFNQINDPSASPTQILGRMNADGQVYVINRNGIIFGGSSQINTRGFTASALPINEALVGRGLLNNPDSQFLFSGLAQPAGSNGAPAFTPQAPNAELGRYGDILVRAGAILESALTTDGAGGRVALVAPNVVNHGTLLTPNGQTILAAGLQVGFAAHRSDDPTLRGLDAYVGALAAPGTPAVDIYAGTITHTGLINTPRGSTSLVGRTLQVDGVIDSTTSVALNGRIDLRAAYNAAPNPESSGASAGRDPFLYRSSGSVLLGEGSVLRILPEFTSTATVAASELALRSQINLQGQAIHLGTGSTVLAPNAIVNFDAGAWNYRTSPSPVSNFIYNGGQIYLDGDALVSVAGSTAVPVSVAQNFITLDLRGSELADSPLQRNSFLRGKSITVDIRRTGVLNGVTWIGTPLANVTGFVGLIERGVGQLTTNAGTVNLNAGGSVVMRENARIDASAGWVDFQVANVSTTRLLLNNRAVDIADALPSVTYAGIYTGTSTETSTRWGNPLRFADPIAPGASRLEAGYIQGANGGQVTLAAASLALDGAFTGYTTSGERQRTTLPAASSLTLRIGAQDLSFVGNFPTFSPTPPDITFTASGNLPPVADFTLDTTGRPLALSAERLAEIHLSPSLFTDSGFGALTVINRDGDIRLPGDTTLNGSLGARLTLEGANIDIQGSIVLPGGAIALSAYNTSYAVANRLAFTADRVNPAPAPDRGLVNLGAAARLDTAGRIVNELRGAVSAFPPAAISAGSISLAGFDTVLNVGSVLDVSGGLRVASGGAITYGSAGSISLSGGRDLSLPSVLGGSLDLGGTLLGHAGAGATSGSLSLLAPLVQIGGTAPTADTLQLAPAFFSTGGFGTFSITGIGAATTTSNVYRPGVAIAAGTVVRPVVENRFAELDPSTPAGKALSALTLAEGVRPAARLTFAATGATDPFANILLVRGEVEQSLGSVIETDAGGRVILSANSVQVQGTILAPGGQIEVRGGSNYATLSPDLTQAVVTTLIGSSARLDVSGRTVLVPDALARRTGSVLAGGTITVAGNILAREGAVLDASGTSGTLDLAPNRAPSGLLPSVGQPAASAVRIDSNGGRINLQGGQLLVTDATLRADAGGADAGGGTLAVSSGRFYADDGVSSSTTADLTLTVSQSGPLQSAAAPGLGLGQAVTAADSSALAPGGHFAANAFLTGGFDHLQLNGNVRFSGPVDIAADGSLRIATGGVIDSSASASLAAPYIALGQAFVTPLDPTQVPFLFTQNIPGIGLREYTFAPVHGTGSLRVDARHLDVGTLSLQQIGSADLRAPSGDIRGNGFLNLAGDLTLAAGQIYPTTDTTFTATAFNYTASGAPTPGSITVNQVGTRPDLPASAAGTLNLYAAEIIQTGTLRAPFGVINLGRDAAAPVLNPVTGTAAPLTESLTLAPGGLTSVSALRADGTAATLPYGVILDGVAWIDPRGVDITRGGLPAKSVNLSASDIATAAGSVIDTRGGGDIFAYRFIPGAGGTTDPLTAPGAFAVIPGAQPLVAPSAPFNPTPPNSNLGGDPGYINTSLAPGDQVFLSAASGLPAGTYTLLPARYALLPGAYLITASATTPAPAGAVTRPDGSVLVSGYRLNGLNQATASGRVFSGFEVVSRPVLNQRGEFQIVSANKFLADAAIEAGNVVPRLPQDAGRLAFLASRSLAVEGFAQSTAPAAGRGAQVDVSSALDIRIIGPSAAPSTPGTLSLDSSIISQFGAASLLVGGLRTTTNEGDFVTATTRNLTVDNAGAPLVGSDLILVARERLTLADGAELRSTTPSSTASVAPLVLGSATTPGSGDGALLRVSAATSNSVLRRGVSTSAVPTLALGENVALTGGSLVLDSSSGASLAPSARLQADSLALNSGRISLLLDDSDAFTVTDGLVLSDAALDAVLASARSLSLLSYSSLDLYGTGTIGSASFQRLTLSAPALRHFGSGDVEFRAARIQLGNTTGRVASAPLAGPLSGDLRFVADSVLLSAGTIDLQGFSATRINATDYIQLSDTGSLLTRGDLALRAPIVTATTGATQTIDATGNLAVVSAPAGRSAPDAGLGAELNLLGAKVSLDGDIRLPSGSITARARSGDLVVGATAPARLDASGTSQRFRDLTRVTDGGSITLRADQGDLSIASGSILDVSAPTASLGRAGSLTLQNPQGDLQLAGSVRANGSDGSFALDTAALSSTATLDALLNAGGFSAARDYRIRTGDVALDGPVTARRYTLAADNGDLTVTGRIDASGPTGGTIALRATDDLTLASGASLDVSGQNFSAAGKGGSVTLEAGAQRNGVVSSTARLALQSGSTIDLSVAAQTPADSALGRLPGTLSLRAPLTAAGTDVRLDPIAASIVSPSHVSVEGYRLYDLNATTGVITIALQNQIRTDATTLLGAAGDTTAAYTAMRDRLLSAQPGLAESLVLRPGAEIIHRTGDLALGATNSTATSDWNLATFRFGPNSAPGALTLRAAGDLIFFNALSDGFGGGSSLWLSPLLGYNAALPANLQSWDLSLTAGSDLAAADSQAVRPAEQLALNKGHVLVGKNTGSSTVSGGNTALTATLIANNYQVIRTGSGDITVAAGRDIRLLNPFASIYTAGTAVPDPTNLFAPGDFSVPLLTNTGSPLNQGSLGSAPQVSTAQYSYAGGDVSLYAANDLARYTRDALGNLIPDSSRQLPNNWLYRRGVVDAAGNYGSIFIGNVLANLTDPSASTSWWVGFNNFFQGVGALGGGDVSLRAGRDVVNVDAVIPTNARTPSGRPDATKLVELGGGDLSVHAGRNIDGGVYYVQRGTGDLHADGDVTTNATRSVNLGILASLANPVRLNRDTWLPTTLFVGDATFDVSARGNILLGPIANPHLLPQGNGNRFWYKTYFSTYGADSSVNATSLTGDLTLRNQVTLPDTTASQPFLTAWLARQNLLSGNSSAAFFQPWLRLAESSVEPFGTFVTVLPPDLRATAFTGDINLAGNFNLFPSATGTVELLAAGAIDGLSVSGASTRILSGQTVATWYSSRINLSDAAPASLPGLENPFAYFSLIDSASVGQNNATRLGFLQPINRAFQESGATNTVLQTRQTLHSPGLLHRNDPLPVYLYANEGDLSGLTLFSAKPARIAAGRDISDIALYLQNNRDDQISVVSAGRDIVAYAPNSALRVESRSAGNALEFGQQILAGDIQISGPGSLQVLAGRNLDLGVGPSGNNGTSAGITSVGSARNPFLPQQGADLFLAAGIGPSLGLDSSNLDYPAFIAEFLDPATSGTNAPLYLKELAALLPGDQPDNASAWDAFQALPAAHQAQYATEIFHLVLRDVGRNYNDPESPNFRSYTLGYDAIDALFPGDTWLGDVSLTARQIKTSAGGNISILAPGGGVVVGLPGTGTGAAQGILTEGGGNISIFTLGSVDVGTSRIFTLRGGDIAIWSSGGDIAAGSAAKTVRSAPPTRVLIDPQSGAVETDLSGLATGGGIGALATVPGLPPSNITLVAPTGTIDAGDAGIRSTGNLSLAAAQVANAGNIQASGGTTGAPPVAPATPSLGGITAASSAASVAGSSLNQDNRRDDSSVASAADLTPSLYDVEVLGFGGGEDDDEDEKEKAEETADTPI